MLRKGMFYGAVLIGTYLVLSKATGAGRLLTTGATAGSKIARTLQGR